MNSRRPENFVIYSHIASEKDRRREGGRGREKEIEIDAVSE